MYYAAKKRPLTLTSGSSHKDESSSEKRSKRKFDKLEYKKRFPSFSLNIRLTQTHSTQGEGDDAVLSERKNEEEERVVQSEEENDDGKNKE